MQAQINIRLQMAHQQMQSGRMDQAEAIVRQILMQDPGNTAATSALAMLYIHQQKFDLAIETLDQALANAPTDHATLIRLATAYRNLGEFDKAKACYRRCIALNPASMPQMYRDLATTCRYSTYDNDVRAMESAYDTTARNSPSRRYLSFALGKVFDDLKDYDRAFDYFLEGNQIASASMVPMNLETAAVSHRRIQECMDPAFFSRYELAGTTDDTPIIITGLPRSGTTLVEQILASHPEVFGGGEIQKLSAIIDGLSRSYSVHEDFPDNIDKLGKTGMQKIAGQYVAALKSLGGNRPRVTDKSIFNYLFIGLIKVMLPGAKIIICRRDVRDMGLSLFQMDLGPGFPWSYDLDQIRRFHGYFDNLAAHWLECLPDDVYAIQYEDLVSDPERHIRSLLAYCGLDFDPACLTFHATDRVVTTASRDQVRRPIYKGSVGRWKNYRQYLGPLISA